MLVRYILVLKIGETVFETPSTSNSYTICFLSAPKLISIYSSSSSDLMAPAAVLADAVILDKTKLTRPYLVNLKDPGF